MIQKKSFFDILMSKNKPPPKNDENSRDKTIIILDNSLNKTIDSNIGNDCILIDNKDTNKKKVDNEKKVLNENVSAKNNRKNSTDSPLKFKRKSSSKKLDKVFEKFLLDHIKQFSEKDNDFLKELANGPKIKLKEETNGELNLNSFDLTKPLSFDFTDNLKDIKSCECKNELEKFSQEITFSLNNSFENLNQNKNDLNIIIETKLNLGELDNGKINTKANNPDDTINDADLTTELATVSNNSSPRRSIENIYGKRRKIEEIKATESKQTDNDNQTVKNNDSETNENVKQIKKRGRPAKKKENHLAKVNHDDENANLEPITKNEQVFIIKKEDENSNKSNGKKCDSQELWTEKYQFKNEDDIVTNNSQLERLKEWLNNWKSILSKDSSNVNNKPSKSYDSDSDYTYDSDTNSNSESNYSKVANGKRFYSNAILLSGPHGCGKTSSVHSIAKQLNFKVFEVNSSSLRCKSQIIQDLEGALNSHHVSNNSSGPINFSSLNKVQSAANTSIKIKNEEDQQKQPSAPQSKSLESFFKLSSAPKTTTSTTTAPTQEVEKKPGKKRKNSLRRDTVLSIHQNKNKKENSNDNKSSSNNFLAASINCASNEATSVNIHKESLILFDEIDVVFREDVGFWTAINHFIKRSRKPIILTTNDEFLQEKINLNVEKIEFIRPRIDASTRFLKSIALKENIDIDTHMAYKIIRDCKCDMRRALVQLQVLLQKSSKEKNETNINKICSNLNSDLSTLDLNRLLTRSINNKNCKYHNENAYFNNISFLDLLTKRLKYDQNTDLTANHLNSCDSLFKRYDLFILRDGLTDNTLANSSLSSLNANGQSSGTSSVSSYNFNPFIPQSSQLKVDTSSSKSNAILVREHMFNIYDLFIKLFNDNKMIDFTEWSKHGQTNQFNYPCNLAINRFAQALFKFTSNESISLDYRPYLQQMCHYEKLKQQNFTGRRRYNHYFTYLNIGLMKDDYNLLAKSNLIDENANNDNNNQNNNDLNKSQDEICFSQQSNLINADLFTTDS